MELLRKCCGSCGGQQENQQRPAGEQSVGVLNIQNQASLEIAHVQASEALWGKSRWWQEQLEGCLSVMGNVQSYLSSVQVVVCQCQQLPSKTHSVCKINIIFTIRANSNFGGFRTISSTGDGSQTQNCWHRYMRRPRLGMNSSTLNLLNCCRECDLADIRITTSILSEQCKKR